MIVVGLTSGASVSGIDVIVCEIRGGPPTLRTEVLSSLTIPWPLELRKMVLQAWQPNQAVNMEDLCLLDVAVGEAFAAAALEGIAYGGLYPEQVDLVGLQGQTVWHQVREDGHVMASLQLGQAAIVAEWTGITTISNFQQRDIAAGGQGAPLMGYVDWLLLRHPQHCRAVQLLDSISSVTFLPPLSMPQAQPVAFDTGPGTALIDYAESRLDRLTERSLNRRGEGTGYDPTLLSELMADPYLQRQPPKTVGNLMYDETFAAELWDEACQAGLSPTVILETFIAFTVFSIADAYKRFASIPIDEVILGGKGRHYPHLMRRFREVMAPLPVHTLEDVGMDSETKASLAIAVLAYETWHNRPCTLPSLTGAHQAIPLGSIIPGQNYQQLLRITWST